MLANQVISLRFVAISLHSFFRLQLMYDAAMFARNLIPDSFGREDCQHDSIKLKRRRAWIGLGLSVLVHALFLLFALWRGMVNQGDPVRSANEPLVVRLLLNAAPPKAAIPQDVSKPKPLPEHRRRALIALPKPNAQPVPTIAEERTAPAAEQTPPADMMAMIEAARAKRNVANKAVNVHDLADQSETTSAPSNDTIIANINHSLQAQSSSRYGTAGVFQVLHMGPRMAEFSFRGWTSDSRRNWKQVIEVDAGPQGDVELAVVRRMIELIRSHYDGDFNWESRRLQRVIVLSARIGDSAGLENFLMREFFGGA
jgi:hypothetical protein